MLTAERDPDQHASRIANNDEPILTGRSGAGSPVVILLR
jgi:deazaflavin-dependent oxidoreductase (nitroreductase family)